MEERAHNYDCGLWNSHYRAGLNDASMFEVASALLYTRICDMHLESWWVSEATRMYALFCYANHFRIWFSERVMSLHNRNSNVVPGTGKTELSSSTSILSMAWRLSRLTGLHPVQNHVQFRRALVIRIYIHIPSMSWTPANKLPIFCDHFFESHRHVLINTRQTSISRRDFPAFPSILVWQSNAHPRHRCWNQYESWIVQYRNPIWDYKTDLNFAIEIQYLMTAVEVGFNIFLKT